MAEVIVGVVGVALAVPSLIDVLIKGGERICKRVEECQHMDEMLARYRQLGLDLHSKDSVLYAYLDALRTASRNTAIPNILKDELEASLQRCKKSQKDAIEELNRYSRGHQPILTKIAHFFFRGSTVDRKYEAFKGNMNNLETICQRMDLVQQNKSNLLRPEYFKLVHETFERQPGGLLPDSDIWVAVGNYHGPESRQKGNFVLEKKYGENDLHTLCNILREAPALPGILPCLGYRQPPYNDGTLMNRPFLQLVMTLPPNGVCQSLVDVLDTEPAPPLPTRIAYAKALVSAVISVHHLGLVHKAIRSRAILHTREQTSDSKLFLQDWTYVRQKNGATSQNGSDPEWQRNIYLHPERQHSDNHRPETEYEPRHDIYSLGVVLMEILLWTPFVQQCDRSDPSLGTQVAKIYEDTALGLDGSLVPRAHAGDSGRLTRNPVVVQQVWTTIANRDLDVVAPGLASLVTGCLENRFETAEKVLEILQRIQL